MPSDGTPQKKAAANSSESENSLVNKDATAQCMSSRTTGVPTAKKAVIPRMRPRSAPCPRPSTAMRDLRHAPEDAYRHRTVPVGPPQTPSSPRPEDHQPRLVACFPATAALTIRQLTIPSAGGVYTGLAALCATSIGICITLHRCKHDQDNGALPRGRVPLPAPQWTSSTTMRPGHRAGQDVCRHRIPPGDGKQDPGQRQAILRNRPRRLLGLSPPLYEAGPEGLLPLPRRTSSCASAFARTCWRMRGGSGARRARTSLSPRSA